MKKVLVFSQKHQLAFHESFEAIFEGAGQISSCFVPRQKDNTFKRDAGTWLPVADFIALAIDNRDDEKKIFQQIKELFDQGIFEGTVMLFSAVEPEKTMGEVEFFELPFDPDEVVKFILTGSRETALAC